MRASLKGQIRAHSNCRGHARKPEGYRNRPRSYQAAAARDDPVLWALKVYQPSLVAPLRGAGGSPPDALLAIISATAYQ